MKKKNTLWNRFWNEYENADDSIQDAVHFQKNSSFKIYDPALALLSAPFAMAKAGLTCAKHSKHIKLVQSTVLADNLSVKTLVGHVAGLEGRTDWRVFKSPQTTALVVEVYIERGEHQILMQYLVNPSTSHVKMGYIELDRVAVSLTTLLEMLA